MIPVKIHIANFVPDERLTAAWRRCGQLAGVRSFGRAVILALAFVVSNLSSERHAGATGWPDYQIIMWQKQSVADYRLLRSIGVTAAALLANRDHPQRLRSDQARDLIRSGLHWYIENIATDFYSAYHRYSRGRPPNWRFIALQQRYASNPGDPAAMVRVPSLSDSGWLRKIGRRLRTTVKVNRPYRPLFYNLADEPGIADLNAFWDFDFSKCSLVAMRRWLRAQYHSLTALNGEWGTRFRKWGEVRPMTTADALQRTDGNYAAWSDFRAWMDVAFADAFARGSTAVHAADPSALAGLEGGQKPGWGGFNYETLGRAVDVMETDPQVFPLVHALHPSLILLSTLFGVGPLEEHRIWRALLNGGGGIIIWDDKKQLLSDGSMGERGRMLAPLFRQLRSGLGTLIANSQPAQSEVAILYSPESMRAQWLLDRKNNGDAWFARGAEVEDRDDNTVRNAMDGYTRCLEQLGFAPTYLSPDMLEQGAARPPVRLLVLPHTIALSERGAQAIADFVAAGGTVVADTMLAVYDEHGRARLRPGLSALLGQAEIVETACTIAERTAAADPSVNVNNEERRQLGRVLQRANIVPPVEVTDEQDVRLSDIGVHTFRDGDVTVVALQRDAPSSDVKRIVVHLPKAAYIYDVNRGALLGLKETLAMVLTDAAAPQILAFSPRPLPRLTLKAALPRRTAHYLRLRFRLLGADDATFHVVHLSVLDPHAQSSPSSELNVVVHGRAAAKHVSLGRRPIPGVWTITATDVLSGQTLQAHVRIGPG